MAGVPPDLHSRDKEHRGEQWQEHEARDEAEHPAADEGADDRAGTHDQDEGAVAAEDSNVGSAPISGNWLREECLA